MPSAKIKLVFGKLTFSVEGREEWIAEQLDKICEWHMPESQTPLQINHFETHKLAWPQNPGYYAKKHITGSFGFTLPQARK